MNPELIAKLKSAGLALPKIYSIETVEKEGCPGLSQLIDACGDRFNCLFQHPVVEPKKWVAGYMVDGWEGGNWADESLQGFGDTPEEAVANLYLALNKKSE